MGILDKVTKRDFGKIPPKKKKDWRDSIVAPLSPPTEEDILYFKRKRGITHGKSEWPEYGVWVAMKTRCESNPHYKGRGITVCERWLNSFEAFIEDMGRRPEVGYDLDRKDNDGNYEKSNCRWVTRRINSRNKQNTRYVTYRGKRKRLVELVEESGLSYHVVYGRLRLGWSIEDTLRTPVGKPGDNPIPKRWSETHGDHRN